MFMRAGPVSRDEYLPRIHSLFASRDHNDQKIHPG